MSVFARNLFRRTEIGRLILIPARFLLVAGPYVLRQVGLMLSWAFASKEYYNHSYHLTKLNQDYLANYVAMVTGQPLPLVEKYINELQNDVELRDILKRRTLASSDRHSCDVEPRFGRRLGWYALIRATKPRVVLETGIDRGLGTVAIAAALKRNTEEGCPGLVYATDIIPDCGHLLTDPYKSYCRILIGDSISSLKQFAQSVDVFLHDSNHDPDYEWGEFLAIETRLHSTSLILSDNSQQSPKLREFAVRLGKSFLYFQDQPANHWWPGDGIGAAFTPGCATCFQSTSQVTASQMAKS